MKEYIIKTKCYFYESSQSLVEHSFETFKDAQEFLSLLIAKDYNSIQMIIPGSDGFIEKIDPLIYIRITTEYAIL